MTKQTLIFFLILLVLNGLAAQEFIQCQAPSTGISQPLTQIGAQQNFSCSTTDNSFSPHIEVKKANESLIPLFNSKVVSGFYDVNYGIYTDFNHNINDTRTYIDSLLDYNEQLFVREGFHIKTRGYYIWTSPEPFLGEYFETAKKLTSYFTYRTKPQEDYTMLLQNGLGNVGQASINSLCAPSLLARLSVASVQPEKGLTSFPVSNTHNLVIAHEIGHVLGSRHTFDCVWGSNRDKALDDCGLTPSCSFLYGQQSDPTIMGYCVSPPIMYGFGQDPLAVMHATLDSKTCIKDSIFYANCQLQKYVIWHTYLPNQTDTKATIKGIVYGPTGATFKTKITSAAGNRALDSLQNLPYNTEIVLGRWLNTGPDTNAVLQIIDTSNPDCSIEHQLFAVPPYQLLLPPDLSLTAATTTPAPAQWAPFSVTYTLTNSGTVSLNIQVEIPEVTGAVYLGGNVAQASVGTFDGIKNWAVPQLGQNESATLTLNYFNLTTAPKRYFAQVTAMSGTDLDSQPGNNTTGTPNEDDETTITINGGVTPPPTCQITANTSAITCNNNNTPTNSTDDTWSFALTVSGSNTGTQGWQATVNGQTITGSYGSPKSVTAGMISGGQLVFAVGDKEKTTCTTNVTVQPPAPCSTTQPPAGPCASKSDFPWHEWIAEVQLGTYVNASGKSNFTDYRSASVIDVQAGTNVKLTTEFSYFAYDEYWKIWIDLNGDGSLDDATETVFQGKLNQPANGNAKHAISGALSIPASAQAGTRLMRVSMKRGAYPSPCETLPFGEVEDYTARVVTGGTPVCSITAQASNVVCNNNGTATVSSDDTFGFSLLVNGTYTGTLGWTATVANQTLSGTYGIAKTFSGFAISSGNLNFTVRDAQTTTCQATVTVQAPATCSGGVTPPPQPCASAGVFPWHEWISRVRIGSAFDYQSGKSTFSDFKTATATAVRGQATAVQLTSSFSWFTYDEYYKIWVDINRDGAYEDATEMFYQGILTAPAAGTASKTLSGTMTIPAGTAVGSYTMRISMKRGGYPTPCESIAFGEVEEYTLQVNAPQVLQSGNLSDVRNTELPQNELVVYPNPATNLVHVQWPGASFGRVSLYSATGAALAKAEGSGSVEFDVSALHEGLYFVRVEVDGKRAEVKRVVVVR